MCLKFAKNCLKNEKAKKIFQTNENKHPMKKRKVKKLMTKIPKTKRYQTSSVPYMVKLLNDNNEEMNKMTKI